MIDEDDEYRRWYENSDLYKDQQYEEWYKNQSKEKSMGYLYLNFIENLESGLGGKAWGRDDFYTNSLNEQYEALKPKLGNYAPETLQQFIAQLFPTTGKEYYVSLPGFDRAIKENRRGKQCIYNFVIRAKKDMYTYVMSDNYDVIIIGDVTFGNIIDITVKGIELIDVSVAKFGEKSVYCTAACAFTKKVLPTGISVPDYGTRDLHDSVLTNNFVDELCNELFPVPNPREALKTFDAWQKYIDFRKYYLNKQSEKCKSISAVEICDSYMISREAYRRREEEYAPLLLDGVTAFAKGEQVILTKEITGSESFPLIRVDIDKNRKEVLSETTGRFCKGKPKFEADLQRYTRDAMGLSASEPRYDENGNLPKGYRFNQYVLGERYLFAFTDIEPDCEAIENKFEKACKATEKSIDEKYVAVISTELNRFMSAQTPTVSARFARQLDDYVSGLNKTLEGEIRANNDKEVQKEFDRAVTALIAPIKSAYDKERIEIERKISKLKKGKDDKEIAQLQAELSALKRKFEEDCAIAMRKLNICDFYIARNEKLIANKRKSLDIALQVELDKIKREKEEQLWVQYRDAIHSEKETVKKDLTQKRDEERAIKIENETVRRYRIYFRPDDINKTLKNLEKEIGGLGAHYLTYDNRAEKAKIERQEKALASFMGGYVKNPYLPAYLFAPQSLGQTTRSIGKDINWCLESLNDRQKTAVTKALASESLFLLQGPPGTGKTQVIAEITAQLCRRGKKVLISSETHKAIDNVFERLPKIPEIRPLRLIPSQNGKETNYSPERLVDNFYLNISRNLEKQINRFEHFEEAQATFSETMKKLRLDYDRVLRLRKQIGQVERERQDISSNINKLNDTLDSLRGELSIVRGEIERYKRTIKYIEAYRFTAEEVEGQYLEELTRKIETLLLKYDCFADLPKEKVSELIKLDVGVIKDELGRLMSEDTLVRLKNRQKELRDILSDLRDPETDEAPQEGDAHFAEYKKYQSELVAVGKDIKKAQEESEFDMSESVIFAILPHITNDKLRKLPDELTAFKIEAQRAVSECKDKIEADMKSVLKRQEQLDDDISGKQLAISNEKRRYEELGENQTLTEYGELNSVLKQSVSRFMRDFDIVREYDPENMEEAFSIIAEEWKTIENDYQSMQSENVTKIPMYRGICKYLEQPDILEEDRQAYTRALFDNVNVFGITCTSRDRFTKSQLEELGRYGIEDVNIRTQGIDVVIIDEVSKSSFLDLLIPILYGKTVILVGDHRQLPPMYDLRHMRADDFEGLDENIITKEINDRYTALYEECFFKTLYEKVPDDFRVMLNKQYRCHSHIMEVFNHFYGGSQKGLTVGTKQQDNEKQHNLTVRVGGNTVIDPEHHIYFIDCEERESSAYEGSTSKVNEQEARVAIELLNKLDSASGELVRAGKFKVNKEKRIDERPSVGVICTYGDQAGLIKKKRKGKQFNNFSGKQDEKLIISTVDDFQGDERDIIILSMVRNPAGKNFDLEFLKKFERINVALSRARKLLIVVGARKFLSENSIIDLPDMEGNHRADRLNFPVYKEIIDTIYFKGKIIPARDIIGE